MTSPFGIPLFSSVDDLQTVADIGQGKYEVAAPKPHPSFNQYIVQATPALGIVWIKANSPARDIDAFGHSLVSEVDRIADQIAQRYGRPAKSDFLLPGSIWDGPQYWMNALADGQRFYSYLWERNGTTQLPEELVSVFVGASAYSSYEGVTTVEYATTAMAAAEAEVQRGLSDYF